MGAPRPWRGVALVLAALVACTGSAKPAARPAPAATEPQPSVPSSEAATSTSAPPTTAAPIGPAGGPVPAGFVPASVTFVSLLTGWVLGSAPCATPPCTSLLRTRDGGKSWRGVPAPPAVLASGGGDGDVQRVRFADAANGWVFGPALWATHDGGAHWARSGLDGAGATARVYALEAAAGVVHAVVFDGSAFRIETSPVGDEAWKLSPTTVPFGAGPVPQAQLVLQGSAGWVVLNNRIVVGGARLVGGRWASWTPPCISTGGPAVLAAATAADLVVACHEGVWDATPRADRLYASSDGGVTFRPAAGPAPLGCCRQVATPVAGGDRCRRPVPGPGQPRRHLRPGPGVEHRRPATQPRLLGRPGLHHAGPGCGRRARRHRAVGRARGIRRRRSDLARRRPLVLSRAPATPGPAGVRPRPDRRPG